MASLRALRVMWAGRALEARGDGASLAAQGLPLAGLAMWLHGPLMLLYRFPLITWVPVVLALDVVALGAIVDQLGFASHDDGLYIALWAGPALAVASGAVFGARLRAWTAAAVARERDFDRLRELPATGTPRLLPGPLARGSELGDVVASAHIVFDGETGGLVWSKEVRGSRRGPGVVWTWPQDSLDTRSTARRGEIARLVPRVGRRSLPWRAYERHYLTLIEEPVTVLAGGGRVVAVAPYLRYRGFPVRRASLAGVHVLHEDGRLEDLTVDDALMRREIAASGRVVPEQLALEIARACGRVWHGSFTNDRLHSLTTAPYLTLLADWERLLSNQGAAELARGLHLSWRACCDADGNAYDLRRVTEARPVFAHGRLYYLVAIVPTEHVDTKQPVDRTVLIDARERSIVRVFDHASSEADDALRAFFSGR